MFAEWKTECRALQEHSTLLGREHDFREKACSQNLQDPVVAILRDLYRLNLYLIRNPMIVNPRFSASNN
jgi:hypothetical protein